MKLLLVIATLAVLSAGQLVGQLTSSEQAIVDEGRKLYRLEMASWFGTDALLAKYPELQARLGGYFSYVDGPVVKCLFYTSGTAPKVLITFSFDSVYSVDAAVIDNTVREMNSLENELYAIRAATKDLINRDTFFLRYPNSDLALIPIIEGSNRTVFILTGPKRSGVVYFGNDYVITFDSMNKVQNKKRIHRNIIPVDYRPGSAVEGGNDISYHSHMLETGDLITSTDICTLMLYAKIAGWSAHLVMGEKSVSVWTCAKNLLDIVSKEEFDRMMREPAKPLKKE